MVTEARHVGVGWHLITIVSGKWIPAFAGMTVFNFVIPAKAGISLVADAGFEGDSGFSFAGLLLAGMTVFWG